MKTRSFITFLCVLSIFNFLTPISHSAQTITGQVLFRGQPSVNFEVLLWRNGKIDTELPLNKKLMRVNLETNGLFSIPLEAKNFTIMLFPSYEDLKGPIILYDFEDEKLLSKIVLSEIPQVEYNIKFEDQNNAISQFAISSFINVNSQMLLKGSTYILDPTGIKVPVPVTAGLPKFWSQEADAINEKISRLQEYAVSNSQPLSEKKYLVHLSRSLFLARIPRELLYISVAQIGPQDNIKEFETVFIEISQAILRKNQDFTNRIISLVSSVNSQINENLKKTIDSKKQQQIIWENPTFTKITLSKNLLSLRLSSTSKLNIDVGSYTQNVCSVIGNKIRLISRGICSLYVLQAGDGEFLPTPPFTIDFLVQTPVVNKTTITCTKGKVSMKSTGLNPKCPAGYRKK